jgi:para-nitrobenzyl esterase
MLRIYTVLLGLLMFVTRPLIAVDLPRAGADGEILQGQWAAEQGVAVFRGVPFAEPPTGQLRWQKPRALIARQEVRPAQVFAPACMQTMRILDWYRDLAELFGASRNVYEDLPVSEDCLYLNVWSPSLQENAALPVMVWIHGGSNNSGWAYEPNYHGQALAAKGVVVVSIAYRVGVFGFFTPPGLLPGEAQANFGLWDQIAALQWIQRNIRGFGGDPGNITLFGESSGAENITSLMFSPQAAGLFRRVILESTPAHDRRNMPTLQSEQARGRTFAQALGLESEGALEALRSMPAEKLFARYQEQFGSYRHYPVVDGQLLLRNEWIDIDAGRFPVREMLIGSNANEAYAYLPENLGEEDLARRISATRYLSHPDTRRAVRDETDPRRALDRILSADSYGCHSQAFAEALNAAGCQAWVYRFSRVREGAGGEAWGAYHGTEYPYVFDTHDPWLPTTRVDRRVTDQVMGYWTRFARTGNPNGQAALQWPRFQKPRYQAIDFDDRTTVVDAPDAALCNIYRANRLSPEPSRLDR